MVSPKQSGGGVAIHSQKGNGTIVRLLLPLSRTRVAAAETGFVAAPLISASILLVEDNDEAAEIAVVTLQSLGYRTRRASDARVALAILGDGAAVDLVITDIIMPGGLSGLDLAHSVRRRFGDLPVLLTTGYSSAVQQAISENLPVLRKPYRRQTLAETLQRLLQPRSEMAPREEPIRDLRPYGNGKALV
jgi:CheY-like chemotaxis protein